MTESKQSVRARQERKPWCYDGGRKTEHLPPAQISTQLVACRETTHGVSSAAKLWQKMLTQIYLHHTVKRSRAWCLPSVIEDLLLKSTWAFSVPTYVSIQPSNETSPYARASVLPEGAEVDSRHSVSCRAPLAPPPVGGRCEHAGVFSHGVTLTQAPLIPPGRDVIAT